MLSNIGHLYKHGGHFLQVCGQVPEHCGVSFARVEKVIKLVQGNNFEYTNLATRITNLALVIIKDEQSAVPSAEV